MSTKRDRELEAMRAGARRERAEWEASELRAVAYAKAHPREDDPALDAILRDINGAFRD